MRIFARTGLFFVLIIIAFSCTNSKSCFNEKTTPHHFAELQHAKDLMDQDRQKAFSYLDSLELARVSDQWSLCEQHELRLFTTEAQYRTRTLNDNSPDLHQTVAFFDSLSILFPEDKELRVLQSKAHYYLGTLDRYHQRDVEAATDFVGALKILQEAFPDSNEPLVTRFAALSYFRLGEILLSYNIQAGALEVFESARERFLQVNDSLGVAASIRNIGEVYQSNKDYEKALARFQEANRIWNFGEQLYDHAIGGLFFNHQQLDSACLYLERSFVSSGPYSQIDASAKLAEIYKEQGNKEKEDYYTLFYVQNSIREASRSSNKMEIEFILDTLRRNATPETSNKLNVGILALIVAVVLVLLVLALVIVRNRKRISHIEQHISNIEQIHRKATEDKEQQIKSMEKQLDDTRRQLKRQETPNIDIDQALNAFLYSPICQKIHRSVDGKDIMIKSVSLYPQLKLSEMEFIELVQAANKNFPDFSSQLLCDYSSLSTADVRHCCLALMGMNDAEIAVLEGITYSGSNRRTKRILSTMNEKTGLAECVLVYLKSLYG